MFLNNKCYHSRDSTCLFYLLEFPSTILHTWPWFFIINASTYSSSIIEKSNVFHYTCRTNSVHFYIFRMNINS